MNRKKKTFKQQATISGSKLQRMEHGSTPTRALASKQVANQKKEKKTRPEAKQQRRNIQPQSGRAEKVTLIH